MTSRNASVVAKGRPQRRRPRVLRQVVLRVTLREIEPAVWRLIRVPEQFTLHQLHRVLQIVFSRLDYHPYEFQVGTRRFEAPDPDAEGEDATRVTLADLNLRIGMLFAYIYDFGDNWEHAVAVEQFLPMPSENGPDWSPRLLDGVRAAPPEDAGGPSGYHRMITALGDPQHPEHDEYRQWIGDAYDPNRFDSWSLDHALALTVAWSAV